MEVIFRIIIGLSLLSLMSCEEYGVQLRIENRSQLNFDQVAVNNVSFGSIESSEISSYVPFESIYKREFVEVTSGTKTYRIIPETFNPEDFYDQGNYKYILTVSSSDDLRVYLVQE